MRGHSVPLLLLCLPACATLAPAPRLSSPVRLPLRQRLAPRLSAVGDEVPAVGGGGAADARPPYLLTGLRRPRFRGSAMGWLHRTGLWYVLATAYVAVAAALGSSASPGRLALRVLAAAATCANVWISDGYHNGDKRGGDAYTAAAETVWLRWDYVGISSVLTTQLWLWSANFGWPGATALLGGVSGAASASVLALAQAVVPRKAGHTAVKLLMGVQFGVLLGYLVRAMFCLRPAACRVNATIFWLYLPGLVAYAVKRPQHATFGFHEFFHSSVLLGHSASMLLDVANLLSPCVACLS